MNPGVRGKKENPIISEFLSRNNNNSITHTRSQRLGSFSEPSTITNANTSVKDQLNNSDP